MDYQDYIAPFTRRMLEARGFEDVSWHNDACASFLHPQRKLRVWIEARDPAMRERQGLRFAVAKYAGDDADEWVEDLIETDHLHMVLMTLDTLENAGC